MLYCQVVFPRGAGLGTRLFPWARCIIFAHVNRVPMLAPQWVQPRVGPLLRGGIDLRAYHRQILLLGLFKPKSDNVVGLKRIMLRCLADRVSEPQRIDASYIATNSPRNKVITFEGCEGLFEVLDGWDQFLDKELRTITRARWLRLIDTMDTVPVGMVVRLGNDFSAARSPRDFYTRGAIKTPLSWYIDSLRLIREHAGFPVKAVVTSDGTRNDLGELLDLGNVAFARPGCAVSDLSLLARSQILIASGGSSFSAWAAFLGQMPVISHPGQSLVWFKLVNRKGHYVGEFDPASPDPTFMAQVRQILC